MGGTIYGPRGDAMKINNMDEWIAIERWAECQQMARPGFVFEIRNGAGQSLLAGRGPLLSQPFDWSAGPVRFRMVREGPRSGPISAPRG